MVKTFYVVKMANIPNLVQFILVSFFFFLLLSGSAIASKKKWYDSVIVGGGVTSVLQGTSGNDDATTNAKDNYDFAYTINLNIDFELAPDHRFLVHMKTGEGSGVSDNFATNINPAYDPYRFSTRDTGSGQQDITLSQAYYEGTFADETLTISAGKMDIHSMSDENEFAGNEKSQFLSSIFTRLAGTLFAELDNYYSPGIRFLFVPIDWFEFTYIAANSNNDSLTKKMYHVGQMNVKPNFMDMPGNYRLYMIKDNRNYTKIDDASSTANSNFVWGVSFDQLVTENIGLFFRYASQNNDLTANTVTKSMSGGAEVSGNLWKRRDDFIGIGYGNIKKNTNITDVYTGNQRVIELYYHFQLWDNLSLTPDLQMHKNLPRGASRDVTIWGVRAQLDFF